MTNPIIPTPAAMLPPAPQPTDPPALFDTRAAAFVAAQVLQTPGMNKLAEDTYTNALAAGEKAAASAQSASDAAGFAAQAADTASVVAGAANFKGVWNDMPPGPISKPASVKHKGRFWLLLNNLANVKASEPGVTADWTSLDSGRVIQRISANTTAVPGVFYEADTAGITLTYGPGWLQGDETGGRNASSGPCFIAWGGYTIANLVPDAPMIWPPLGRFESTYSGVTFA